MCSPAPPRTPVAWPASRLDEPRPAPVTPAAARGGGAGGGAERGERPCTMRWLPNGPRGEAEWEGDEPGGPEGPAAEAQSHGGAHKRREGAGRGDRRSAGWLADSWRLWCLLLLFVRGRPTLTYRVPATSRCLLTRPRTHSLTPHSSVTRYSHTTHSLAHTHSLYSLIGSRPSLPPVSTSLRCLPVRRPPPPLTTAPTLPACG